LSKKVIIFLNGLRGIYSLKKILEETKNVEVSAVITPELFFNSDFLFLTEKYKFKHLKTDSVNNDNFIDKLDAFKAHIFLIIGFSEIFTKKLFNLPEFGTYNFHAGKLPEYRGGSPINWQIINNEKKIGISIIKVNEIIDGGPIALSDSFNINNNEYISDVHYKINEIFANLSVVFLKKIFLEQINLCYQLEENANYWHQRNDNDGYLNFKESTAEQANNFIRAISYPYPGAWGNLNNTIKIRFFESELTDFKLKGNPGRVCFIQKNGPFIICKDKGILIKNYSIESSNIHKLNNSDFIN